MAVLLTKTALAMAEKRGMNQNAFRIALNVSAGVMTNWKRRRTIPADQHEHVAEVLKCSIDELLGRSPPTMPTEWPFKGVHPTRFYNLTAGERMRLEGLLVDEIAKIESEKQQAAKYRRRAG